MRLLADECCPRALVERLRADGHDVRYAAETDRRADDEELLARANEERRVIVTEDFDFGDLLVRDQKPAIGIVIVYLPQMSLEERSERLANLFAHAGTDFEGALTVVEARRMRQRRLRPR